LSALRCLEEIQKFTFFMQKINTAHRLLDWQAFGHLARFYVPESDRLVITARNEPFSYND
jgi:hypothetical protein